MAVSHLKCRVQDETMYQDYYGEPCARLGRHDSIFVDGLKSTEGLIFRLTSALLFHQPAVHFQQLRQMYVDDMITVISWSKWIEQLLSDWENSITPVRLCSASYTRYV